MWLRIEQEFNSFGFGVDCLRELVGGDLGKICFAVLASIAADVRAVQPIISTCNQQAAATAAAAATIASCAS